MFLDVPDEGRLIIALIFDTGMKLSETLGLVWNDINIQHHNAHIYFVSNPKRTLKTAKSKTLIALVGALDQAIKIPYRQRTYIFYSTPIMMRMVLKATHVRQH